MSDYRTGRVPLGGRLPICRTFVLSLLLTAPAFAEVKRVVIVKLDGVPASAMERYMGETNPRTGKSRLPWFQYIFAERGVRMNNFYTRGLSLSVPSWSMLDTGRPTQIKGNVEYDRYSMWVYDYLNFITFYFKFALRKGVDMESVETLDDLQRPLLIDRFPYTAVHQSYQLFQRGVNWKTLQHMLQNRFTTRPVKELFDEWQIGVGIDTSFEDQMETELIAALRNPEKVYLDIFSGDFDHVAHLAQDPDAQLAALEKIDAMVGRIYSAIQQSPLAAETAMIVVSDHGMNSSAGVYSQGFNLVDYLGSAEGGGHHVVTNRYPLSAYRLKGLFPFVYQVFTPASESAYLDGKSQQYPTAMIDLDGNERANFHFRNSDLNALQILFEQLRRPDLPQLMRRPLLDAFFSIIDRHRSAWQRELDRLSVEMEECRRVFHLPVPAAEKKRKFSQRDWELGIDTTWQRAINQREQFTRFIAGYETYIKTMRTLMGLNRDGFDASKWKPEAIIPPRAMGESNTIYQLQNYVVGPAEKGMVLDDTGGLDWERSFRRADYFDKFLGLRTRNNVQKQLSPSPVDFTAAQVSENAVWLSAGNDRQLVVEWRRAGGQLELRCMPVRNFRQDEIGLNHYEPAGWKAGLPLQLFEDPGRDAPAEWLSGWHEEREWFRAIHRTRYSNGVIGLYEQFHREPVADKFQEHRRELARTDMMVFANDHWNFNVRGFNPGGNHGSLLRISTHSVLMWNGGSATGIRQGASIDEPYDSLSFMPTVLHLLGKDEPGLPGPLIKELK